VLNTFFALDQVKKCIGQLKQPYQGLFFKWGFFCLDGLSISTSHLPNQDHYHKNDGLCTCFVCFTHKEAKLHIGNKWA
jgi:hypothetical protein